MPSKPLHEMTDDELVEAMVDWLERDDWLRERNHEERRETLRAEILRRMGASRIDAKAVSCPSAGLDLTNGAIVNFDISGDPGLVTVAGRPFVMGEAVKCQDGSVSYPLHPKPMTSVAPGATSVTAASDLSAHADACLRKEGAD